MDQQTDTFAPEQSHPNLLLILFAGFVLSGVATVIIGPLLPVYIRRWSLDDGQAGLFSTIQFSAAWVGTLASSAMAAWGGYRRPLVLGYILMGGGLFFLNADAHLVALAATGVYVLGYGLITPGSNLLVAELGGAKSTSLLNLLNFSWGVGAMVCSPLVSLAIRRNGGTALMSGLTIYGGLVVLGLLFASFGKEERAKDSNAVTPADSGAGLAIVIALAALFFIYVAVENGIGIWAAEYAKRLANGISGMTTLAPMFFYLGLTSGRLTAPLVLMRLPERKIVLGALALTVAANIVLIASPTLAIAIIAVFFAGLGCASVYPIYIAWLSRWYGPRAKKIGGILFALASLGGSVGPALVGFTSKVSGSLRIGLIVPLLGVIAMIGLVLALRRQNTA